ncbi:MAG: hypothetical protein IJJ52_01080 [Lachnospiraceae bacterium]|nr:hypothetical protein [Lachnospiraceae bacterium]
MAEQEQTIFRQKTLDRISSPDQLTDYLRVTNPGVWAVLAAVILLLSGMLVWSAVGTLETKAAAKAVVSNSSAQILSSGGDAIKEGMPVRIDSKEYTISSVGEDEYGRIVAQADVALPDGTYNAEVITERIHPISFLLESR